MSYKLYTAIQGPGIPYVYGEDEFEYKEDRDRQYEMYMKYYENEYLKGRLDYYIVSKKG